MSFINSTLLTLILLSVLVVVHEYGHFITARMFGLKVHEFAVGFGPVLAKTERGGVQYSIRWILLGGFCKIAGMDMEIEGEAPTETIRPEESFQFLKLWKKVVVIAAGPFFNLVLGIILFFVTATLIGLPTNLRNDAPVIEQAIPGTPAFEAGIRPGDRVMSINEEPVTKWQDISRLVKENGKKPLVVKIIRNGQPMAKRIIPQYSPTDKRYIIGINAVLSFKKVPVREAAILTMHFPWNFTKSVIETFALLFTGKLGSAGLMGPIGMVSVVAQNLSLPLYYNFSLAIGISMFLFLFNMLPLPLPLLDGGWIIILLIERLIGREFSAEQKAGAQMFGLIAVIALGLFIAFKDTIMTYKFFIGGQ